MIRQTHSDELDEFNARLLRKLSSKMVLDSLPDHAMLVPVMNKLAKTKSGEKFINTVASAVYNKEIWGEAAKNGCNKTLREGTKKIAQHAAFALDIGSDIHHTWQGDMSTGQLFKRTTAKTAGYSVGLWATGLTAVCLGTGPVGWIMGACISIGVNMATSTIVNSALDTAFG